MRTIAILNLKGGVGKTVTAVNLSYILAAEHKQRVLLIDADSQCNSTEFFGVDPDRGNLAQLMTAPMDPAYAVGQLQQTQHKGLDILAASMELMDLDLTKLENKAVRATAISELLAHLTETDQAYDTVLVDCPPAFNAATASALLAANEVVIPIKLDAFSLRGMANLLRQVRNMRKINPALRVSGCLVTMYYKDQTIDEALQTLQGSGLPVFAITIRRSKRVDGMSFAQQPLSVFSPRSAAGIDYRAFARELIGGAQNGI